MKTLPIMQQVERRGDGGTEAEQREDWRDGGGDVTSEGRIKEGEVAMDDR